MYVLQCNDKEYKNIQGNMMWTVINPYQAYTRQAYNTQQPLMLFSRLLNFPARHSYVKHWPWMNQKTKIFELVNGILGSCLSKAIWTFLWQIQATDGKYFKKP